MLPDINIDDFRFETIPGLGIKLAKSRHTLPIPAAPHDPTGRMWRHPFGTGRKMAEYISSHEDEFDGQIVADVGTGSGLLAIAAARAGAKKLILVDSNPYALAIAVMNLKANGFEHGRNIEIETVCDEASLAYEAFMTADSILASDVFYFNNHTSVELERVLLQFAELGKKLYMGSPQVHYDFPVLRTYGRQAQGLFVQGGEWLSEEPQIFKVRRASGPGREAAPRFEGSTLE